MRGRKRIRRRQRDIARANDQRDLCRREREWRRGGERKQQREGLATSESKEHDKEQEAIKKQITR